VRLLSRVEVERSGDAVDDALGDAGGVTALEADVVLRRDAGQQRHLLTTKTRDTSTLPAVRRKPGLRGRDPRTPGREELTDLCTHLVTGVSGSVTSCHGASVRALPAR